MVQAIINISGKANRVLNIIKARYNLKDKSQAINVMAEEYEELVFEPQIKNSYIKKLNKVSKERKIKVGSMKDFDKMFNIKE